MADNDIYVEALGKIRVGLAKVRDALRAADGEFAEAADLVEIMGWPGKSRQLLSKIPEPLDQLVVLVEQLIAELEPRS